MFGSRHDLVCVQEDGHRTVVDEIQSHMGAKGSFGYFDTIIAEGLIEILPDLLGMNRFTCCSKAGAIAVSYIGEKGELWDGHDLPTDLQQGEVHFSLSILKEPHVDNLPGGVVHLVRSVMIINSDQEKEPLSNTFGLKILTGPALTVNHIYACPGNPLYDNVHVVQLRRKLPDWLTFHCWIVGFLSSL